eukprot:scaffold63149_cov53-Phaeocystis_antarctica.AAC.2
MAARAEEAALRSAAESRAEVALPPPNGLGGGAAAVALPPPNAGLAGGAAAVALPPPNAGLGGGAAEMVLSNAGLGGGAAAGARSSRTLWSLGTGDQRAVCDLLRTW